jgi:hypothetical protein
MPDGGIRPAAHHNLVGRLDVTAEEPAEQAAVIVEDLAIAIAHLADEAGRTLHVGEEEGDRAGRKVGHRHHRTGRAPPPATAPGWISAGC